MKRDLAALERSTFDVVVVGAGAFGAWAAWDAAQRGLSVALLERADFGAGTSSNPFKLIHGGIRYLQHGDLYRIRQSANARRAMLRVAPHLVKPQPFVIPTYGHGMKGKELLGLGLMAYDLTTADRNRGISDPARRVPRSSLLSRREALERYPGLETSGLTGAGIFYDGLMHSPPRVVLALVRSAAEAGAVVANYCAAQKFLVEDGHVSGIAARDTRDGNVFTVRARTVLNAAGPHAEGLLEASFGQGLTPRSPWSRDTYFIVPRPLIEGDHALAVSARTFDPDAVVSRGSRHLFLVPWHGSTLVGTWHTVYQGEPDAFDVTDEELTAYVDEINASYPILGLTLDDVALCNAGLVLFGDNDADTRGDLKYAHRSRLTDHATERGIENLVTLIGVRFTTGQPEAAKAVDVIVRKLGRKGLRSRTHEVPLHGGRIDNFDALVREAVASRPPEIDEEAVRSLVHGHGSEYGRVLDLAAGRPDLDRTLAGTSVLRAEVVYGIREEMAVTLSDIAFRRTDLATGRQPPRAVLEECARLMAEECQWNPTRLAAEIDAAAQEMRRPRAAALSSETVLAGVESSPLAR